MSGVFDEVLRFIPLMSQEDEDKIRKKKHQKYTDFSLRNTVLFPGVVIPITVGRDKSIKLIKEVYKGNKSLGVVSQKDLSVEEPSYRFAYHRYCCTNNEDVAYAGWQHNCNYTRP